jgi:intein/homing endonuclease
MLHNDADAISDYCRYEDTQNGRRLVGDYAEVFRKAIALEGTFQNQGKHAAGVIISSENVAEVSPMCLSKDGVPIAAFDMGCLEKMGLVKFDFLGVDILNKIQEAWGPDIVSVPLDDQEAWDVICGGNTKGCFQIEGHLGRDWAKEIRPRNIEELSAVISVIRPGSLMARDESGRSMTKVYADRKNGLEPVEDNPINRVIDTYGVLVYQETLQIIAKILAGFNCADGIKLMKCISGDSLIYTSHGPKRIDQASSGDDILNIIDGKLNYSKIKKVWSSGIKKVFRLSTVNGFHIDLTDNHQVMTNEGWLPVSKITEDHFVLLPRKYTHAFTKSPSKSLMIISAYFLSEGCYTEKTDPKITNADPQVIALLEKAISDEFGENQVGKTIFSNGVIDLKLIKEAGKYFRSNFQQNRSKDKSIPPYFMRSSMEHRRTFVSCYFNGDGTVGSRNLTIDSASIEMLRQIQSILLGDGIHAGISQRYHKERKQFYFRLSLCNRPDISTFENLYSEYICDYKKQAIRKTLERESRTDMNNSDKKARVPQNIVKACFGSDNLNKICGHRINVGQCYNNSLTIDKARYLNDILDSDLMSEVINAEYYYYQISEVSSLEEEVEVFDYETDDDSHCGFINGILVHNSVGKKDAKLLFSLEDKFLSGCLKTGTIPKDDAVKLFTNIKSSARYLFNKSISSESITKCRDGSTKTIAQIQAGDEVMTPTGFAKVIAKYDHGVMDTYSATFSNGSNVRCSINHKFLCENGDILPLGQILYERRRVIAESKTAEIVYFDYVGKENLWDIEIDSEDHIYFANGVATSNSHGVSYSYPSYWSAYIKAHKPLKFYEVWLKYSSHKLDPHAEVRNLVLSAKLDNVEILPPSCEYLTEGFFIKDDCVVFGLSHIKGVANRELEKLFALMRTHGVRASLVTYLTEILPNVNKRTCEALINCGCFHYLGVSRAALLHYYECFSDLSDKELTFFSDKSFESPAAALEAAAFIKKEGGACATKGRVEKLHIILERLVNPGRVLHDLPGKIAASEEAAIGITLSCSYMDACLAAGMADTTCKEIMRGKPGKRTIVVRVVEVKEHVIKSSDKKMGFLTVSDDSAEIDNVVCFADQYEMFGRFLYDGAMVAICGELGKKRSFVIDRVVEL